MIEGRQLFKKDLLDFRLKATLPLINRLEEAYVESGKSLLEFLEERLSFLKFAIEQKQLIFKDFEKRYQEAVLEHEQQIVILEFAKELGASPQELQKDKQAFSRWFDFNAVGDRCRFQISSLESELSFIIDRLSLLMALESPPSKLSFLHLLIEWAQTYPGNYRIKIRALESILKLLTPDIVLDDEVFRYLSLSEQKDVWIQCNAISILKYLNPIFFNEVVEKRLKTFHPEPDFFVRQHITTLLTEDDFTSNPSYVFSILNDPSEFVRLALCQKINFLSEDIVSCLLEDTCPQVRALAILNITSMHSFERKCAQLYSMCKNESHSFVLRVCLKCITDSFQPLPVDERKEWLRIFEPVLEHLHTSSPDIPTRRRAAQTREELWCEKNPSSREIKEKLTSILMNLKPGTGSFLTAALFTGLSEEEVGRLFSVLTQRDFGCELKKTKKGYKLFRGSHFKFRLWRFLYEFFHPKTEKREGIKHTIGRHFRGEIQVPSSILAELSQTGVPGEPLYIHEEGGYRPYLPLVDHLLSILQKGRPFSFYTSEGITEVSPPAGFLERLKAKMHITLHFSSLAELRNWRDDSFWKPSHYIKTLEKLGFKFHFSPYENKDQHDETVTRFFAGFTFFYDWETLVSYVLTISKTSMLGLSFCLLVLCIYFFWNNIRNYKIIKIARASLPMVIGGWGTRGKSSTDRLKAALINGIGLGVFAKTTGCEAKITFAGPYQKMHEIPYYRPYGKVSIWEQAKATVLASRFKTDVMVWECMALQPEYVKIMQREWMVSDMSTLTNAYPDHEDIQGPAGYNVAQSLLSFTLSHRKLLTAEEQMLPYFRADAFEKGIELETVGWLEEGLITNDFLDRFPYKEHAQNITLVLKMAEHFNVSAPAALKEMADEVIPDIGALKVYPVASLNFRSVQFVNGMSANEEYGCLTNWYRLGFEQVPPPGEWISTFVNNRVDRVARSRVFAQLLVHNLSADKHFIVGSNINVFMGFVAKAWAEFLSGFPISHNPQKVLETLAHKLRICFTSEDLKARLFAMGAKDYAGDLFNLQDLKIFVEQIKHPASEALLNFHQENTMMFQEYHALYEQLLTKPDEAAFKETLTKWFMNKFVLPKKNILLGDDMIAWMCEQTPPYYLNKIMGIQNIKGPGLEFIYRWQAWEKCYLAGKLLFNPIPHKILQGFRNLMELNEFGLLSQDYLKEILPKVNSKYDTNIHHLKRHIKSVKKERKGKREEKQNIFIQLISSFFDINVAYNRTKKANKIYEDLSANRISYVRAHEELEKLVILNNKE